MKVDLQSPVDLVVGMPGTLHQFCEKGMEPSEVLIKFMCRNICWQVTPLKKVYNRILLYGI